MRKKEQLQNDKHDNQLDKDNFPQRPADSHLPKAVTIKMVNFHKHWRCHSVLSHTPGKP
jgi:hypothetical protein